MDVQHLLCFGKDKTGNIPEDVPGGEEEGVLSRGSGPQEKGSLRR